MPVPAYAGHRLALCNRQEARGRYGIGVVAVGAVVRRFTNA